MNSYWCTNEREEISYSEWCDRIVNEDFFQDFGRMNQENEENHGCPQPSMDSLGLSWRDFF